MEIEKKKKSHRYPTGKLTLLQSMALLAVVTLLIIGVYELVVRSI